MTGLDPLRKFDLIMADANTPEINRLEKHQAAPVRFSPIMG
jgi:hypothetical protein